MIEGDELSDGRFPRLRVIWFLLPPGLLFLFFPFRILQWAAILTILLILIAYAVSYLLYRSVAVKPVTPIIYCYRNQEVYVDFAINNGSTLPMVNTGITIYTPSDVPEQQKVLFLLDIGKRSCEKAQVRIRMTRRGEFTISPVIVEGSDPLSIFPWKVTARDVSKLVVYPKIHHGLFPPRNGVPAGAIRATHRIYDDVNRIGSIRDYLAGDDIRKIHWKASAKSGELRVTELLPALDAPAVVLLDLDSAIYPTRYRYNRVERAIETAASLVHGLGLLHQRVGFVCNGLDAGTHPVVQPAGHGESAFIVLRILARISTSHDARDPLTMFQEARFAFRAGLRCFLITPRAPSDLATRLSHPTIAALRPRYIHLGDRRADTSEALPIVYRFIDDPAELMSYDG